MKKMPKFLKRYFWDVDFEKLDYQKFPQYVIARILEYGHEKAIKWLFEKFSKREITTTLCKRRGFTSRTANFWALILGVKKDKVLCLSREYLKRRKVAWPY